MAAAACAADPPRRRARRTVSRSRATADGSISDARSVSGGRTIQRIQLRPGSGTSFRHAIRQGGDALELRDARPQSVELCLLRLRPCHELVARGNRQRRPAAPVAPTHGRLHHEPAATWISSGESRGSLR